MKTWLNEARKKLAGLQDHPGNTQNEQLQTRNTMQIHQESAKFNPYEDWAELQMPSIFQGKGSISSPIVQRYSYLPSISQKKNEPLL